MLHNKTPEALTVYLKIRIQMVYGTHDQIEEATGHDYRPLTPVLIGSTFNVPRTGGLFDYPLSTTKKNIGPHSNYCNPTNTCEVTPGEVIILDPDNPGPLVVAIDTGIKTSIVNNLRQRGAHVAGRVRIGQADLKAGEQPDLGATGVELAAGLAVRLLESLQDLGAAGLTSSSSEMASKGEVGIDIDIDRVPLREADMEPFEIMVSESQERMLCVVEPDKLDEVLAVCEKWEVRATAIGEVTDTRRLRVLSGGEVVGDMPVEALVDDCPVYDLEPAAPAQPAQPAPARKPSAKAACQKKAKKIKNKRKRAKAVKRCKRTYRRRVARIRARS